jgi:parallel beta-helix repeat protein
MIQVTTLLHTVANSEYNGIELDDSGYNTIANNSVFNNSDDGMDIDNSFNNTIINNTVEKSKYNGIALDDSRYNTVANNSVFNNSDDGIDLDNSSNNMLINNTVYSNTYVGIGLDENATNNHIYHNNLIYNDEQASDDGNNNSWDNGPIIGGNYWSDHKCVGNPSDGSQPYYIGRAGVDSYPFEDPIGELPPLPPPVPRTDVNVDKTEGLSTSDTYIDHKQLYNFDIVWYVGVWDVKNLDNVTITITTPIGIAYAGTWALCDNGSDTWSVLPFTHIGENYTWVIPLKDRFASNIEFYLPDKTVQSNPWADMTVNTMDEDGCTRLNVTIIPRIPSVSVDLNIWGAIIDYSCPSEFGEGKFLPDSRINFYGGREDLNQGQSYNFSILVNEPKEVELWLDRTSGGDTEFSNRLTLPVSELGSVTVAYDVPVKWEHGSAQPQYTQSIRIEF